MIVVISYCMYSCLKASLGNSYKLKAPMETSTIEVKILCQPVACCKILRTDICSLENLPRGEQKWTTIVIAGPQTWRL